jgi:hypothetical protein
VQIPKTDGSMRTLRIRSILDRTVSAAVLDVLTPIYEDVLFDGCMGYRPGRGIHDLLANVVRTVEAGYPVIAQADIKEAFDHVPIADALEAYRENVPSPELLNLIEILLRGSDGPNKITGVDQGDPLSPLTLNAILNTALDAPLERAAQKGDLVWLRYADNIIIASQADTKAGEILDMVTNRLATASMSVKPESSSISNLRRQGAKAHLLGFELSGVNPPAFTLGNEAFKVLHESLEQAHQLEDPDLHARSIIDGWIEAAGPGLGDERRVDVAERILMLASQCGLYEVLDLSSLVDLMYSSYRRWHGRLSNVPFG